MSVKDLFGQGFAEAIGRYRAQNPMTPALRLCAFVTMPCLALATFGGHEPSSSIAIVLLVIAAVPILMAAVGYFVLLFFDREKFQSEPFRLHQQEVKADREKGESEEDSIKEGVKPSDTEFTQSTGGEGGKQ